MTDVPAAIAVFVKTPGLSRVKTRLAEGLDRDRASEFYRLSIAAIEATVATAAKSLSMSPYWAVAESAGLADPRWHRFPRIFQGTGSLGKRLARVFGQLGMRHRVVLAIGGDSPQITPKVIGQACNHLTQTNEEFAHVLGRCHDGGFYLVGSKRQLPPDVWTNISYSTSKAADHLSANLAKHGRTAELDRLTDVDQAEDLDALRVELAAIAKPYPEQLALLDWAQAVLNSREVETFRE